MRNGIALSRILILLVFGACVAVIAPRTYRFNHCNEKGAAACPTTSEFALDSVIPRDEACADSGYLCVSEGALDLTNVLRWRLSRGNLVVRVALPTDVADKDLARAYQSAAIAGLREWDGHPFRIDLDTGSFPTRRWDISLFWTDNLSGVPVAAEGVMHSDNTSPGEEMSVRGMAVMTGSFANADTAVEETRAIAAHEFGHALGLGHSDDIHDVMSGKNGGGHPHVSDRDIASIEALYRLPIGARVEAKR